MDVVNFRIGRGYRNIAQIRAAIGIFHARNPSDFIRYILLYHKSVGVSVECNIRLIGALGGQ